MRPVAGLARLPGRVSLSVDMENFSPVEGMKSKKQNLNGGT